MTATYDFDAILASVLEVDGPQSMPATTVETALGTARTTGQRRPLIRALDTRAWPAPALSPANPAVTRVATIGLVLLLLLAGALTLITAARLLERRPGTVIGEFRPTTALPPGPMDNRYINAVATLHDGRILATGMYSSSNPPDTWAFLYDPTDATWSETGRLPEYRQLSTATTLTDGRVLIVGGWRVDAEGMPVLPATGEIYDPATGTFAATRGSLTTPRYGHTATLLSDGRVLVTGGAGADFNAPRIEMASAEIFDPTTGSFTPTGPMNEPRELHAATRLPDGRVLVTGGMTSRDVAAIASAEIFDPATATFTPVGSMGDARNQHASIALADGRVLVVGGSTVRTDPDDLVSIGSAEVFDPATGMFTQTGPLATERSGPGVVRLADGRVLVAGGANDYGAPRTAELFDPAAARFEPAGESAGPHGASWAGVLPDGRVLLLGLVDDPASSGVPEVWTRLERPAQLPPARQAARGFKPIDVSTGVLRAGHTATLLADGRILLTGGTDAVVPDSKPLDTAEILDPKTGRSQPVDDMSVGRSGHVAVLLPDGRVLVAGGEAVACPQNGECVWPNPRAEVFDPATGHFATLPAKLGPAQITGRAAPPAAALLADGRVLYIGVNGWTATIDPLTGDAVRGPSAFGVGVASLVSLADGRVFVQAGSDPPGAQIFDPTSEDLTTVSPEDWDASVVLADGQVLVVRVTGDAAIFDPASSTFTPTGSMARRADPDPTNRYLEPYPRRLTVLPDGRVLVTGGRSSDLGAAPVADADLFDSATGTFRPIGPMHDPRSGHSATVLDDGRVAIIGGVVRSPDRTDPEPAFVEVFDPSALP